MAGSMAGDGAARDGSGGKSKRRKERDAPTSVPPVSSDNLDLFAE